MPLRPAALATTMVVASLASGVATVWRGNGFDLGFDGTFVDLPDALALWMMTTFTPLALITAFFFTPSVALLERFGVQHFSAFLAAGFLSPLIPAVLLGGPDLNMDAFFVLALPGSGAGLCWWWLAIERDRAGVSSL